MKRKSDRGLIVGLGLGLCHSILLRTIWKLSKPLGRLDTGLIVDRAEQRRETLHQIANRAHRIPGACTVYSRSGQNVSWLKRGGNLPPVFQVVIFGCRPWMA